MVTSLVGNFDETASSRAVDQHHAAWAVLETGNHHRSRHAGRRPPTRMHEAHAILSFLQTVPATRGERARQFVAKSVLVYFHAARRLQPAPNDGAGTRERQPATRAFTHGTIQQSLSAQHTKKIDNTCVTREASIEAYLRHRHSRRYSSCRWRYIRRKRRFAEEHVKYPSSFVPRCSAALP